MMIDLVKGPYDGVRFHVERRDFGLSFFYVTSSSGIRYMYSKWQGEHKAYYERIVK